MTKINIKLVLSIGEQMIGYTELASFENPEDAIDFFRDSSGEPLKKAIDGDKTNGPN